MILPDNTNTITTTPAVETAIIDAINNSTEGLTGDIGATTIAQGDLTASMVTSAEPTTTSVFTENPVGTAGVALIVVLLTYVSYLILTGLWGVIFGSKETTVTKTPSKATNKLSTKANAKKKVTKATKAKTAKVVKLKTKKAKTKAS